MNRQISINDISTLFQDRKKVFEKISNDQELIKQIILASNLIIESFRKGGKLLIFGNGGSAAEAQHFSAELVGRFKKDRKALPAIALTTDTSILTAQANDSSFSTIFSRQVEALVSKDDIVFALTTSDIGEKGHSENIFNGLKAAKDLEVQTIGLFSEKTKKLLELSDISILVPQTDTALIQEIHLTIIHIICGLVEEGL